MEQNHVTVNLCIRGAEGCGSPGERMSVSDGYITLTCRRIVKLGSNKVADNSTFVPVKRSKTWIPHFTRSVCVKLE